MNIGEINFSPVVSLWLIIAILISGFIASILQYITIRRRINHLRAGLLSTLRFFLILILVLFCLNPSLSKRKESKILPSIAVLIDTSQSMGVSGQKGKPSPLDELKEILLRGQKPLLRSLSERFNIRIYKLGDYLRPLREEDILNLRPQRRSIDLKEGLKELGVTESMILLFSDGNLKWDGEIQKGPPIFTIPMGNPDDYRDILIKEIKSPSFAFRGREVLIDVTFKSYGYKGNRLPVILREGGKIISTKSLHIKESPFEDKLTFSFIPERIGIHNLNISISPQSGEAVKSNNESNIILRVLRDKIRILMVSGSPSMNYRFMRMALKNDPSIELLSFIILRTPSDILNVPLQEQSLIPFPVDTLFAKELRNFDILIFDNLPAHLYIHPSYFRYVREFVRDGGGFAMIGGPNLMDGGRYFGSPVEEIIPVRPTNRRDDYRRDKPFRVRLNRKMRSHPLIQLSPDENENLRIWEDTVSLDGINILNSKDSGFVLLESDDELSHPILILGENAKGRSLVIGTDYFWKWYMGMVENGKGNWAYLRFIDRMVRWLTRDPRLEPFEVILPDGEGEIGKKVEFRIKVKKDFIPTHLTEKIFPSVFNPDGKKIGLEVKKIAESGEYICSFLPEEGGLYRLKVDMESQGVEEFIKILKPMELQDPSPKHEFLRFLSNLSGGKNLGKRGDLFKEIEAYMSKEQRNLIEEKRMSLFSFPVIMGLIFILLGIEWYLRRRWGLF